MTPKEMKFGTDARAMMKKGIDKLASAVKVTLGPKGQFVILDNISGIPSVTKDGVSVARRLSFSNPYEDVGARLLKDVASKTCNDAGDGTTTATVLAQALVTEGLKNVASGANPRDLKAGMEKALNAVTSYIAKASTPVKGKYKMLENVALVSANGDKEIAKVIVDTMKQVGPDGTINVAMHGGKNTTAKVIEGMNIGRGYISPAFITDHKKSRCVFDNPLVLLLKDKVVAGAVIVPYLEEATKQGRPIYIIAEALGGDALGTVISNTIGGRLQACVVKAPGYAENRMDTLDDIALLTGSTVVDSSRGNSVTDFKPEYLGTCDRVIVDEFSSVLECGESQNSEAIKNHVESLRSLLNITDKSNPGYDTLKERIARLAGGVGVIYVGGSSDAEVGERKDRVDDALCSTRAAVEEGIVPGGSLVYINSLKLLSKLKYNNADEKLGIQNLAKALEAPLKQIAANAGLEGVEVLEKVKRKTGNRGYNALTDKYEDLLKAGVIDPAKVARVALENAVSMANLVLTTGCIVVNEPNSPVSIDDLNLER